MLVQLIISPSLSLGLLEDHLSKRPPFHIHSGLPMYCLLVVVRQERHGLRILDLSLGHPDHDHRDPTAYRCSTVS